MGMAFLLSDQLELRLAGDLAVTLSNFQYGLREVEGEVAVVSEANILRPALRLAAGWLW